MGNWASSVTRITGQPPELDFGTSVRIAPKTNHMVQIGAGCPS